MNDPLKTQVGEDHYRQLAIDPFEYAHANGIGMIAGTAIKYLTRYKSKNGREDLEKAVSCIQRLIALEYPPGPVAGVDYPAQEPEPGIWSNQPIITKP